MASTPLQTILERIGRPFSFASRDGFAHIASLADIGTFMTVQVGELRKNGAEARDCDELLDLFRDFDGLAAERKIERIRRAQALLSVMAGGGDRPSGAPAAARPHAADAQPYAGPPLTTPVQFCKGIGPKRAELLGKLGMATVEDAIFSLPWRYEDRGNLKKISRLSFGAFETVMGTVVSAEVVQTKRQRVKVFELVVTDGSGMLVGSWFNQPFMKKAFAAGQKVVLSGIVKFNAYKGGAPQMDKPEYEVLDDDDPEAMLIHAGRIVPVYRATAGLSARQIRTMMKTIVDAFGGAVAEVLPPDIVSRRGLMPAREAVREVHFPEAERNIEVLNRGRSAAHRRMSYEELFILELGLALRKAGVSVAPKGIAFTPSVTLEPALRGSLPFALTGAQERVVGEIKRDMASAHPMNRLVQGDVGSGKTVVALLACLTAVENGYQACLMAPTEILAEQHFRNFAALAGPLGLSVLSLTGSKKKKEKAAVMEAIADGSGQIVVGTHALIEEDVRFHRLGLAIIDEQHRFGVLQRSTLTAKGYEPDVLVMTATPIPRTLALTVYGDLDVSVIDEMPPGRQPVITRLYFEARRQEAYRGIEKELAAGRQAYVVYPLVEETEKSDLKAATEMAAHLQKDIFPSWNLGLVHGRMKAADKDAVMSAFKAGEIRILVSTTVIEVGVDVPNATVMVIEHPERFGLAQLHQLRGRVGRGAHQSWCILMGPRMFTDEARQRLNAFVRTADGFAIAEEDLRLRGPGEFLGTRQSGLPDLRAANIIRDADLVEAARADAFDLLGRDPGLRSFPALREAVRSRWQGKLGLLLVS
ncbi:MAG: ATP-dependent DNA helicase RecG [Nitrospiraceae bacterium]|nr:ATP-dependent DNA helicase RecG [Nitrospiraceae bacterium]